MGLLNPWKIFLVSADTTDLISGDQVVGNKGRGYYKVTAVAAAANDGTITINDGDSDVVSQAAIPVRGAAVTFPEIRKNEDHTWVIYFRGATGAPQIDISDGTNAEVAVKVEYCGKQRPRYA